MRAARARCQRETRHRGNGRERFTAKAQRRNRFEIGDRGDFRRRMSCDRKRKVLALDACAVVGHAQAFDAAGREIDIDLRSAGVETVLEKLFQCRRGPLDDFAGGDLIDEQIRERVNRVHRQFRRLRDQRA